MQYAVYDYAVKFRLIRCIELFGVGAYRVQADEQIARQFLAFAVVECNDVRVIIMLQILAVYFQNLLVRAKMYAISPTFLP